MFFINYKKQFKLHHIIDHKIFNKPWGLSSSDEWKEAFILDKKDNIKNENAIKNDYFVSDYARDKYNEYYEKGNLKRLYAEDLADSFKYYINSPSLFEKSFPHRYKILEKYLRSR